MNNRKTRAMLIVEEQHNQDIDTLIVSAIRTHLRDSDAACSLGILPSTLSHWIARRGLESKCEEARESRRAMVA